MPRFLAAALAATFFACTVPAIAASTGIVRGTASVDGKAKAGITLTLSGERQVFTTTSRDDGSFVFAAIPFGRYQLTAHQQGTPDRTVDVTVASDAVLTLSIDLLQEIGNTSVVAHASVAGSPVAVTQIDKSSLQVSPVRDSLDKLLATVPGIVQFSYNEPVANGFHGLTYEIDGAPVPIATTSNFAEIVDPRNIDSLEVFTGAIPAEFGGERNGAVVNIITNRFADIPQGFFATVTGGVGNQAQATGQFDAEGRFGNTEVFLNANAQSTNRGLDAPTYTAINDAASQSDQFLRIVSQINPRATLSFDYSNQFSQFQIPINTDPNNVNDPIYAVPGTQDTQLEYDRFSSMNFTQISRDGNAVFTLVPWWRSTRVNYNGDLANDVLGEGPNFGCTDANGNPLYPFPGCSSAGLPDFLNNVGLQSSSYANYLGLRSSYFHAGSRHSWKVGFDIDRENSTASQTYACFYDQCAIPAESTVPIVPVSPYYADTPPAQAQAGSNVGLYAEDKWQPIDRVAFNLGIRYDHSSGYTSGYMFEPRIGVNVSDGGANIFHAYYGRNYAAPTLEDVRNACVVFEAQGGCATTTPVYDLQPERDAYYELGLAHQFAGGMSGWVNFFQKTVTNVLDTTQLLNTPLFAVYNNAIGINSGVELRLQDRLQNGNSWFVTGTVSGSYAGGISGSTFLFPPNVNNGLPITSGAQLSVEDHDETVVSTGAYTSRFGSHRDWFATLQANYGSGFPVNFQSANANLTGRLPAHTTFDLSLGRVVLPGRGPDSQGLGLSLTALNLLNHQYVIKVANGFNTTQIANGRTVLLQLTAPF
jgi:outer membrane receptor protein involved in Fe transport